MKRLHLNPLFAFLLAFALADGAIADGRSLKDLSHILRVQMVVEFDGERVEFDDLVFCGQRIKGTLTTRPTRQVTPTRKYITQVLSDGGMLGFKVPRLFCSMVQHRFDPRATAETEYKAPEGWLPVMHWFDSADHAQKTRGEMYTAVSYYKAPFARLKIIEPIQFSVPEHPFSQELLAEAVAQEEADHARRFREGMATDGGLSWAEEKEWRNKEVLDARWQELARPHMGPADWDRLYAVLDTIPPERGLVSLQGPEFDDWTLPIFIELFRFDKTDLSLLIQNGVPQPGLKRNGFVARFAEQTLPQADRVVPMICHPNSVVSPDFSRRGVKNITREPCGLVNFSDWLEIDGARLPWNGKTASKFYDARSKRIYSADVQ